MNQTKDVMKSTFLLIVVAVTCGARADGSPVGGGPGDSPPSVVEGCSMACQVMSQEGVIGKWIRQARETNDVIVAFDSIVRLGYLHRVFIRWRLKNHLSVSVI